MEKIIKISGDFKDLDKALLFALRFTGNEKNMTKSEIKRGCKLCYQITKSGRYCIGWGFKDVPDGWKEYPFDFDVDIVSQIIIQYLKKNEPIKTIDDEMDVYYGGDGTIVKGFLMQNDYEEIYNDVNQSFYLIVAFEPYYHYYGK